MHSSVMKILRSKKKEASYFGYMNKIETIRQYSCRYYGFRMAIVINKGTKTR